jgi:hypothetical protein
MVDGSTSGRPRTLMEFSFLADEPEGNDVSYMVFWGDGSYELWTEFKPSGQEITFSHAWSESKVYTMNVRAKDQYEAKGPQASLKISITKNRAIANPIILQILEKLIDQFPFLDMIFTILE